MSRYNDRERPEDIVLLDLQICRFNSLGLELNYFIYTSLTGEVRRKHLSELLSVYYKEFESVLAAADAKMEFSEEQLRKEVLDKTLFGFFSAMMVVPLVVCESEDLPDFNAITEENMAEFTEDYGKSLVTVLETNPSFKSRFLALFDDIAEKIDIFSHI